MTKVCPYRDVIARLAKSGKKNSAISSKLGVPLRTVQKVVKQWKEEGHVQRKPRSGLSTPERCAALRTSSGLTKKFPPLK
ncbi:hypothetical protein ANCCEY_14327 [Ancylostoma ceylanicum]|uniref:Paired domain-containing protein n=1 Tax=Ancylostoma ceylanicum TaxID=53326 RepID=A0A0D6L598_9BILA|nr:hypothetical protein ANCCEY_14327 [Ancylostoma ceylanicum]